MRALMLLALLAGCTDVCHSQVANQATVQRPGFEAEIEACNAESVCAPLCRDVFKIQATDISTCEVTKLDASVATVRVVVNDQARCEAGATDLYLDWGDDDDGTCDDGSCDDDGSTDDGTDDGSTDDGTDDGSTDDGSTDDAVHLPAGSNRSYTLAPRR
jgi:hypothetical protein